MMQDFLHPDDIHLLALDVFANIVFAVLPAIQAIGIRIHADIKCSPRNLGLLRCSIILRCLRFFARATANEQRAKGQIQKMFHLTY